MVLVSNLGAATIRSVIAFGDFCRFCATAMMGVFTGMGRWRTVRLLLPQCYEIGSRSVPVVVITGTFIGAVLAVQTIMQFKSIGLVAQMGTVVNLSVLRELGPVLAGVLLAGRVGGGLTAELGTMQVTEQIDALRAMGADPVQVLVMPRLVACVLLIPVLVVYADLMGILGGYSVSVMVYGINGHDFWRNAQQSVAYFDIIYGPIKSVFFGVAIGLISCYKGFRCRGGAAGVGRACTEAFVASCMSIIAMDFFLGMVLNRIQDIFFVPQAL